MDTSVRYFCVISSTREKNGDRTNWTAYLKAFHFLSDITFPHRGRYPYTSYYKQLEVVEVHN